MKYLLLSFSLFMFGCDASSSDIRRDRNSENVQFPITVFVYDDQEDMLKNLSKRETPGSLHEIEGFANWYLNKDTNEMTRCEIHVVRPNSYMDNPEFTTWGHELAHCVYGSFHN